MSETFWVIKKIITKSYKKETKLTIQQKALIFSLIIGVAILPPTILNYFHTTWGKIGILFSLGILINFFIRVRKMVKEKPERDPFKLISEVNEEFVKKGINCKEMIEELIKEVDEEIEKKDKARNLLFKRVSTVFMFVFWIPFCFLTKYSIEKGTSQLKWDDYLTISSGLFLIASYIISFVFMVSEQIDSIIPFEKANLLLVKRYLYDIKYQYIKEEH